MEIVINKCYGGFGLSPLAVSKIAERKGRKCFFYTHEYNPERYGAISLAEAQKSHKLVFAFDAKDPDEGNEWWSKHYLDYGSGRSNRTDADLIAVVRELGKKANGAHAELVIVEIPDGVEYEIDEYDGVEIVHEAHRSWG